MAENHESHAFGGVPDELLVECLNSWPEGTVGHHEEELLIRALNALCRKHGYGGVPQLTQWIEDIWRHPERVDFYKKMTAGRREIFKQSQSYYDHNKEQTAES